MLGSLSGRQAVSAAERLRLPENLGNVRITVGMRGELLQHALPDLFPRRHLLELDFRLDGVPINLAVPKHGPDVKEQAKPRAIGPYLTTS